MQGSQPYSDTEWWQVDSIGNNTHSMLALTSKLTATVYTCLGMILDSGSFLTAVERATAATHRVAQVFHLVHVADGHVALERLEQGRNPPAITRLAHVLHIVRPSVSCCCSAPRCLLWWANM